MPRVLNFYMDDSGTRTPDRKPMVYNPRVREFFALGGVLINEDDEGFARKLYDDFCGRWSIGYPLHSVEIRNAKKKFAWLNENSDERERFMRDLTRTLTSMHILGIACVIDRPGYDRRYREKYGRRMWHLCQTAFCIAVERAAKQAIKDSRKLRVMPERSCKDDEMRITAYFAEMKKGGAPFDRQASSAYAPLDPSQLRSTLYELKFKFKKSPMAQVADLFLHPMAVGGYDSTHRPYVALKEAGRLIECHLGETQHASRGTKYSCFELVEEHKRGA
jgi:hypothetical protein